MIDLDRGCPAACGLGEHGAALVRPDGIVAWRSLNGEVDPTHALLQALARLGPV